MLHQKDWEAIGRDVKSAFRQLLWRVVIVASVLLGLALLSACVGCEPRTAPPQHHRPVQEPVRLYAAERVVVVYGFHKGRKGKVVNFRHYADGHCEYLVYLDTQLNLPSCVWFELQDLARTR